MSEIAVQVTPVRPYVLALAVAAALGVSPAFAATCNGTLSGSTGTTQTVNNGTTCTVTGTVNITSNTSTAAVTLNSTNATTSSLTTATLINNGTIEETGSNSTGRAVATAGTNQSIVIQNTGTIYSIDNDTVAVGTGGGNSAFSTQLTNSGTIQSDAGGQAVNFGKIVLTGNTNSITNTGTGVIQATGSDAIQSGVNTVIKNSGIIKSIVVSGSSSDGIDAQTNTNATITNADGASGSTPGTGKIEGGRHGITGGVKTGNGVFTMSVTNNLGGTIQGDNGSGINIDGTPTKGAAESVIIVNHGTITGNGVSGDGDGVDVDGLVTLTNDGTIRSLNSAGTESSEGVTVGGGSITNNVGGVIRGSVSAGNTTAVARGITIAGIDSTGTPEGVYTNTTITNSGTIRGDNDAGIIFSSAVASGFSHVIYNNAGASIQTGGTTSAAIVTAADAVTINNFGQIDGSSSGVAIKGGSARLTVRVNGGSASILGNIQGGAATDNTLTMDLGTGNTFSYAGSISGFSAVEAKTGKTTFTGVSTYIGNTEVSTGATLVLSGANRLSSGSGLVLNGGELQLQGAGSSNGQSFSSLALTDSSTLDLGASSVTFAGLGSVTDGETLSIIDWSPSASPTYAIRFAGDDTHNLTFLTLMAGTTIDGRPIAYVFDGVFTDVTAVPLPPAVWMLASGLGILGFLGTRRRKDGPVLRGLAV